MADLEYAEKSKRFFKTEPGEYGEGDKFLGIRVPVLREHVKKYQSTALVEVQKLLKSSFHEERLFALLLLVHKFSSGDDEAKRIIYEMYLKNTQYINNWDLVDSSAYKIIGAYLETRDRQILYQWVESDNLWERRIAIMSTFHFIRSEQYDDTLKLSKRLINDPEDLIHKAVGWMLREIGKRDISVMAAFLMEHYSRMPRTMLRYAIEKLPKRERQQYLEGQV